MFSAYEILDIAVKLEKNGKKVYIAAMDQTRDLSLKELLKWMADEEVKHAEWFSELKSEVDLTRELIEIFIEFERDTILFYEMLESFIIDKETGEKLNRIMDEERDHISKLQELLPDPRV